MSMTHIVTTLHITEKASVCCLLLLRNCGFVVHVHKKRKEWPRCACLGECRVTACSSDFFVGICILATPIMQI